MKTKEMFHVEHCWEIKEKTGDSRLNQKGRVRFGFGRFA